MKDFEGKPLFLPRTIETIPFRLSDSEMKLYNDVSKYVIEQYNKALEQKLLKEYEDDNYKYIKERDMEMKKIKILIYEEEMRQIEIEEDIEELRNQGT